MDDSAEEMKLLDTEALKVGAREDEAAGSTRVVLFDSLDEVYGGRGSSANGGGDGGGGGSHGFIFSSFVVLTVVVVVVGHVAESVGAVRVCDGRGRGRGRGSVREEKEEASVRVRERVSVWFERVERSSVVREEEEKRWLRRRSYCRE